MAKLITIPDISKLVGKEYGPKAALVVFAALEIAAKRWTEEDTISYGTMTKKLLHEWESTE